jgi:D-xylulose reductase
MKALVLEAVERLSIADTDVYGEMGPRDVRIKIHSVGICGSDVHYYTHGKIGPFVVKEPMILGHEASGTVIEAGAEVTNLKPGDRVCMEPGIPDPNSRAARLGIYNLDPAVRFWATPPIHGCLCESVVHPAAYTFKLPENVSYAEGAMVEPLAIGVHAAKKARIQPGDLAVVLGAGTIGAMTALAAIGGGCSRVIVTDVKQAKLDILAKCGPITTVNARTQSLKDVVDEMTDGWGADVVFECSGAESVIANVFESLRPGGRVVLIGMPVGKAPLDIVGAQVKEASIDTIFRYAHVYDRAVALLGSGKIDVKPFITDSFPFEDSIEAFAWAVDMPETSVKAQIVMPE